MPAARTPASSTSSSAAPAHSRPIRPRVNVGAASFTITGHGGELLGFSVAGGDFNGDGRNDIGIGAPMGNGPNRVGAGVVYTVFGQRTPRNVSTTELNYTGFTNDPSNPAPHSPIGSRYEGFQPNSHTGTSVAAMPDVNGDGYEELAIGMPDASLHRPGGGGAAVLYGRPQGEHINLADLWEAGYPYYFHVDFPTLDNQHAGETVASVPDMTGDGSPDLVVGAPQSDLNGRIDSGSVWIINGRLPPATGCRRPTVDATCPWIRLDRLSAVQGYRIDGAAAGDGLGSSAASVGDQNGDGRPDLAIGASAASPFGRSGAGEVVIVPGQTGSATRNLAVTPPLQRISGALAGAGLGASLAAAGDMDGDGRVDLLAGAPGDSGLAGAAYLLRGAPNTSTDLALATAKIAVGGAGSQFGSAVAAGRALDGSGADGLVAGPGAGGAFIVSGAGLLNPTTPVVPAPPAAPAPPPPPPVTTTPAKPDCEAGRPASGRQAAGQEAGQEEAAALPAQEAEDEVQDRQGQARQGQAGALPAAAQVQGESEGEGQGEGHDEGEGDRQVLVTFVACPNASAQSRMCCSLGEGSCVRAVRSALIAGIACFGVFSSSVGIGALPTTSLPVYGDTSGEGSRTTVAELGDVNGDGFSDYAVGKPYADANGTDSGIVYVFLGPGVAAPASLDVATASFTITGHGGELLGFSVAGGDFNGDGRADIGIGAPMGLGPNRAGAGVVYTVFGQRTPRNVVHDRAQLQRLHELAHEPGAALADRQPLRGLPAELAHRHGGGGDARRQRRRLRGARDRDAGRQPAPARAAVARPCSTASPPASTSTSPTSGRPATRTTSTSTSRRSTTSTSARRSRACPT